jgi:hypothetical protein
MSIEHKPKFCPKCGTKVEGVSISCSFCGKTFRPVAAPADSTLEDNVVAAAQAPSISLSKRFAASSKEVKILVSIGIGLALIFVVGLGSGGNTSLTEQESRIEAEVDSEPADTSWVPKDYKQFDLDPDLAYIMDDRECQAGSGVCFPMTIVTNKSCSLLYIAANVEKAGSTLESANATASDVYAGQAVKVMLQWKVGEGDNVDFTSVNCY